MYLTWAVSCINAFWCLGAEYSSLSSAADRESLAEKTIGFGIGPIVNTSSYIAVMRDAKLQ